MLFDASAIPLAVLLSSFIRRGDLNRLTDIDGSEWLVISTTTLASLFVFSRIGLYRAILRYMSVQAVYTIAAGTAISALIFTSAIFLFGSDFSRSLPFIYWLVLLLFIGGSRVLVRSYIHDRNRRRREPVIIYGAGAAGSQLVSALWLGNEYAPKAFIDDDVALFNSNIQGLTVYSLVELPTLLQQLKVARVLLAIPSTSRSRRQEILQHLSALPVKVQSIAGMADIVSGKARIEELQDVEIDDLLGRDPVQPNQGLMDANITAKVVMVTGAGGSIGSELCRQILLRRPSCLVLFEISEYGLYSIEQSLKLLNIERGLTIPLIPLLGSVQNRQSVLSALQAYHVQTVYHAAAYKHVPMVEFNMVEGVRNNIFGTWSTANAAIDAGVESFVLISTDKAVRPTNVMGATKRMAELCLQALARRDVKTRFCMVRFGNVLGSSGSVVPLFKKQIAIGGPITVTHPDIIRYFMTIPEASQLVIQAGAMGGGGDVFVLDMGDQVRILDLAHRMIRLTGLCVKDDKNPDGDIEIQFTGLRPGEKLYEELLIGENVTGTEHARILRAQEKFMTYKDLVQTINALQSACTNSDVRQIRDILLKAPTDYSPNSDIVDAVWCKLQDEPLCESEKVEEGPIFSSGASNVRELH